MAIIVADTNLTAVTYAAGEILDIQRGATLTISASTTVNLGSITSSGGTLRISNASTTTPIVLTMESPLPWTFTGGTFDIAGSFINIGTGTGAAQSFDFSTLFGGVLTEVSYVERETSAGSGIYQPLWVINNDPQFNRGQRANAGGIRETDVVVGLEIAYYNGATRTLTTQANAVGQAIPVGCAIRIPNILVTHRTPQLNAVLSTNLIGTNGAGEVAATAGTFDLAITNGLTGALLGTVLAVPFNVASAALQTSVNTAVGAGLITVTGGPLPTFITLVGAGALLNVPIRFNIQNSTVAPATAAIYGREAGSFRAALTLTRCTTSMVGVSLGAKWELLVQASPSTLLRGCGFQGGFNVLGAATSVTLDRLSINRHAFHTLASISNVDSQGSSLTITQVNASIMTSSVGLSVASTAALSMSNVRTLLHGVRGSTTAQALRVTGGNNAGASALITRTIVANAVVTFNNLSGTPCLISDLVHCDNIRAGQAVAPTNVITFNTCADVTLRNVTRLGASIPLATNVVTSGLNPRITFENSTLDFGNQAASIPVSLVGQDNVIQGLTLTNVAAVNPYTLGERGVARNVKVSTAAAVNLVPTSSQVVDGVATSIAAFPEVSAGITDFVGGLYLDYGVAPSAGHLTLGSFGGGPSIAASNGAFTAANGTLSFPFATSGAVVTMPFFVRGVTGFTNSAPSLVCDVQSNSGNHVADVAKIGHLGNPTAGTFTLTVQNNISGTLGTTAAIAFNASAATIVTALTTSVPSLTWTVVGGTIGGGYTIRAAGVVFRILIDGTLLTGAVGPFTAFAAASFNPSVAANGVLTNTGSIDPAAYLIRFRMQAIGSSFTALAPFSASAMQTAYAALVAGGATPATGLRIELTFNRLTGGASDVDKLWQVTFPCSVDLSALASPADTSVTFRGVIGGNSVRLRSTVTNEVAFDFTNPLLQQSFVLGKWRNLPLYAERYVTSTGSVVASTIAGSPLFLAYGDNGFINLFAGEQVAVSPGTGLTLGQSNQLDALSLITTTNLDAAISSRSTPADILATQTTLNAAIATRASSTLLINSANAIQNDIATRTSVADLTLSQNTVITAVNTRVSPSQLFDSQVVITDAVAAVPAAVGNLVVEGAVTLLQSQRLHNAVLGGKVTGAGSGIETFRNLADTKDVLVSTVTPAGNRMALTRNLAP